MRRISLGRSVRLALLGLTLALTALAAVGVASLYDARQRYEDRLAGAYALEAAAGKLLAAGVVEEATLRAARGRGAARERRRAAGAFAAAAAQARALAHADPPSAALVDQTVAAQAALRARNRPSAALRARAQISALAARQGDRRGAARTQAQSDSRQAIIAVVVGGALALLAVLAFVGSLLRRVRRPLDELVAAASRLSGGDLGARVPVEGPTELASLARAFNAMAAALADALERLEDERRALAVTIESLGDALLVVDGDGRVSTTNPRGLELVPELVPGSVLEGARPGLPPLAKALEGDVTLERDGRTLSVSAAPLARGGSAEDAGTVWTVRDVSERARLERLKSEFVATASHELRSPLTSIKGFVELLASSADLDPRQREFIEIVEVSTNRLVDLVNDLLDVARVEAGQVEIHRRPIDLREVAGEVSKLMGRRLADKRQELVLDLPEGLPRALADPSRVRQIIINLLTNAHLYTEPGGRLSIALAASATELTLTVSDTGRGMSEGELERVFERFYRGEDGRSTPGTGLGLAIVKSLVDLHGGSIAVRSAPGEGTTFEVSLPRAVEAGEAVAPRHVLRGKRVLVVDDEPDIARLIAARLEPFGVASVVVTNGSDGVELLRREHFDAMTLDILMPGMSGFEVLRALREDPALAHIPVVIVSVFSGREALSGEWVVSKPIDAEELADALGAAVLAGRVRLLVVGREEALPVLDHALGQLGLEFEWAAGSAAAAQLCAKRHFEVALVDAGLEDPQAALDALDLRGRRLRRSVVVFSLGGEAPGFARLDAEPIPVSDAGAAVLALLETAPADG